MIYFAIIGLPILLAYCSDHTKGVLSLLLFCFALFVPCFFAGVRDATVGTDVMTYAVWTFDAARRSSLSSFLVSYADISALGFNLISWIMAKIGSFPMYLGLLQALVVIPICGYAKRLYPRTSAAAMALYMLLLFPFSLNTMKQMIAVALCVPALKLADNVRPLRFCCAVLAIAYLFHQTAIVALGYYPFLIAIRQIGSKRAFFGKAQRLAVIVIIVALFLISFGFGSRFIQVLSSLKESYSYQVSASGTRLNYSALVLLLGVVLVYALDQRGIGKKSALYGGNRIFGLLAIIGALAVQLNMVADSLSRFSYYGLSFLPLYGSSFSGREKNRDQGLAILLIALCVAYFLQAFVVNQGNQIYPYTSSLLGIL